MQELTEITWERDKIYDLYRAVKRAKASHFREDIIVRIVAEALNDANYNEEHYAPTTKDKGGN